MLFIEYPKCSTCIKARNYLISNNVDFESRDIKLNNPTYCELKDWTIRFKIDIKKMFNTSGLLYKEMNLKDKLESLSDDEKLKLLSTNGMLVKRPILVGENFILFGFKENVWNEHCKH